MQLVRADGLGQEVMSRRRSSSSILASVWLMSEVQTTIGTRLRVSSSRASAITSHPVAVSPLAITSMMSRSGRVALISSIVAACP